MCAYVSTFYHVLCILYTCIYNVRKHTHILHVCTVHLCVWWGGVSGCVGEVGVFFFPSAFSVSMKIERMSMFRWSLREWYNCYVPGIHGADEDQSVRNSWWRPITLNRLSAVCLFSCSYIISTKYACTCIVNDPSQTTLLRCPDYWS